MTDSPKSPILPAAAAAGAVLVLLAAALNVGMWLRVALAVAGLALVLAPQMGARGARHETRRFLTLRSEVDAFIRTVRRLNGLAETLHRQPSDTQRAEFERGCEELVARAEHIGMLAWRAHAELAEGRQTEDVPAS